MKNNVEDFFKTKEGRDPIFEMILSLFDQKPLKIGEIGCARTDHGRGEDGWSTFFWADYTYKNGGTLQVCDIDEKAIQFVNDTIPEKYNVKAFCMDGSDFIREHKPFDFIYLDGSNSSFETTEQFLLAKDTADVFLVDDWDIKGFVRSRFDFERLQDLGFELVRCNHIGGSMALICKAETANKVKKMYGGEV